VVFSRKDIDAALRIKSALVALRGGRALTNKIAAKAHLFSAGPRVGGMLFVGVVIAILTLSANLTYPQQTTNTNCNVNGNNINCTSDTTDYGAQQQQLNEAGRQIGNAIGTGIARARQSHAHEKWVKKFCAANPGGDWRWYGSSDGHTLATGHCPSQNEKAVIAANEFMAHHKDYIPCEENSSVMTSYIQHRNLDPREKKSYEEAFKELKRENQLKLYVN
jgi:hypothetical protein